MPTAAKPDKPTEPAEAPVEQPEYPARPYAEAITPEHRAVLEDLAPDQVPQ